MKTMTKLLSACVTALTLGGLGLGCNAAGQDGVDSTLDPQSLAQSQAALSNPVISIDTAGCNTNVAINNAIGQSFRVSEQTPVDKFEVWIKPELYYDTSYGLEVFDGEGTGGAKLATSQTTLNLGSQTGGVPSGFYAFSFSGQGLTLQPNHAYTFRLLRLSTYSGAFSMCGNVYSGGIQYWLGYSTDPSYDVAFKLYASSATASLYQGCYTDSDARALPAYFGDNFTQESCIATAAAAGYRYAGLQYYGQCFAGNALGYTKVADSQCGAPCNANPSEMCGGGWRNSIFATSSTPPPQPPPAGVYQGCYTDSDARALPAYFGDNFTQESCIATAAAAGYRYAGLQYYGQCFAGNALGYTKVADSQCGTPCNANPSEICGGGWLNSIYTTGR